MSDVPANPITDQLLAEVHELDAVIAKLDKSMRRWGRVMMVVEFGMMLWFVTALTMWTDMPWWVDTPMAFMISSVFCELKMGKWWRLQQPIK